MSECLRAKMILASCAAAAALAACGGGRRQCKHGDAYAGRNDTPTPVAPTAPTPPRSRRRPP
jgi:hypothetical protein